MRSAVAVAVVVAAAAVTGAPRRAAAQIPPGSSNQPGDSTVPSSPPDPRTDTSTTNPSPTTNPPPGSAPSVPNSTTNGAPGTNNIPPSAAPVRPQPAPPSVSDSRWAIGIGLGGESLKPTTGSVGFFDYELAGRLRIVPAVEIDLAVALGYDANFSFGGLWCDFRYRFAAEEMWNYFAYLGLGVAEAAAKDGTSAEKNGRGSVRLGGGVERRFGMFAVSAELRLLAVAKNNQAPYTPPATTRTSLAGDGVGGIGLVFGATYYF